MSTLITSRIVKALIDHISPVQTGFVPERLITDNTQLLYLLQAIIEDRYDSGDGSEGGAFVMLDQEKAFDSISWDTIRRSFRAVGFGDELCTWIDTLYNTDLPFLRSLRINGEKSSPFQVLSGVPQGDIASPIIFALLMEPLARMIEAENNLPGLVVNGHRYKISLYADDCVIFLNNPISELSHMWKIIRRFESATGLRINDSKTEGVALGSCRHLPPSSLDSHLIKWCLEGSYIKCLGAPIGYNFDPHDFWMGKYRTFKGRLARWSHRAFMIPIENRIPLTSTMLLSLFWYNCQTFLPSRLLSTFIQQDIDRFIWKKAPKSVASEDGADHDYRRWMRKQSAILGHRLGGLGAPDWDSQVGAIQAHWIIRYLSPAQASWKPLLDYWLIDRADPFGREIVLSSIPTRLLLARLLPSVSSDRPSSIKTRISNAPPTIHFWRTALSQFRKLNWENTTTSGPSALAIPVFSSPSHPKPQVDEKYWRTKCFIEHIRDLWCFETQDFWTLEALAGTLSPDPHHPSKSLPPSKSNKSTIATEWETLKSWAQDIISPTDIRTSQAWFPATDEIVAWVKLQPFTPDSSPLSPSASIDTDMPSPDNSLLDEVICYGIIITSCQVSPTPTYWLTPAIISPRGTYTRPPTHYQKPTLSLNSVRSLATRARSTV